MKIYRRLAAKTRHIYFLSLALHIPFDFLFKSSMGWLRAAMGKR